MQPLYGIQSFCLTFADLKNQNRDLTGWHYEEVAVAEKASIQ
jgi:hypothetical protein